MTKLTNNLFGKRFWAVLVAILMIVQLLPVSALADFVEQTDENGVIIDNVPNETYDGGIDVDTVELKSDEGLNPIGEAPKAPGADDAALPDKSEDQNEEESIGEHLADLIDRPDENEPEAVVDPEDAEEPAEEPEQPADPALDADDDEPEPEEDTYYTVNFRNRDGDVISTRQVKEGDPIGELPATIAREGYNAYWAIGTATSGAQGTEWTAGQRINAEYIVNSDLDIVPGYDKITYTITFYEEDKTTVVTTRTVNLDTNYRLNDIPAVPTKQGFTGKWVYAGGDFSNNVSVASDIEVWVEYDQNVFTVKFMVEGKEYASDTYYKGDTLTLPADPVVEGKEFIGWYVGETEYVGGEVITSDLTIDAAFEDEFSVSFVILGEDGTVQERLSQYFRTKDEPIGQMPQDPFVAGKVFEKWVLQGSDPEVEVTADTVVTGNMTVVAVFRTLEVYDITVEYYYLNDRGEEVIFNTDVIEAEAHELPYTITAPATTQTDPNEVAGAPIYYPETSTVTIEQSEFDSENKVTVRIKYVPYTAVYDFVYMLKDLTGDGYTEIDRESDVKGVLNSYVTPTVKQFDYAVLELAEGATITTSGQNGQPKQELIVKYTRKSYALSYESNGGSYVGGITVPYGTAQAVTSTEPTRAGYTFDGWYLDAELTQAAGSTVTVEKDTVLYAKWNGATVNYTIVYMFEKYNDAGTATSFVYDNSRNATATVGSTVSANNAPGITRKGWEVDTAQNATSSVVIAADGSSVLYVYYKLRTYTFTFDINGDSTNNRYRMTIKGTTYQDGNNSTRYSFTAKLGQDIAADWPNNGASATIWDNNNGYYFYYWECQNVNYASKILKVTDVMLPNNGTNVSVDGTWRNNDNTVQVNYYLQNADDNGYTLSTLYSQTSPSGSYSPKAIAGYTYDHSDNTTNYWGTVTAYNFYYNRNTYKIDYYYGSTKLNTIENVKFDANINKAPYVWTPTAAQCGVDSDYTFEGWFDNADCQGTTYTFSTMPAQNVVLYAKWSAPNYTVHFVDVDGTTTLSEDQTVVKYGKVTRPSDPTKAGYTFDNWYTTADGNQLFDWNTQITAETTVYAHWNRATLSYTVHYVDEDNNPVAADKTVTNPNFVIDQVITEQAIAVAGYRPQKNSDTLTLAAENNELTFVYIPKADETTYVVKYILDLEEYPGNIAVAAEKSVTVNGNMTSVIELAAAVDYDALYAAHPELNGIEFFPDEAEKSLILAAEAEQNVITFYYSSYKNVKVTVNYVDMNGAPIADATVEHLKVGKTFTLSRTPIAGWELNKAVVGTAYNGTEAGSSYKITEALAEDGTLVFTLFYQKKLTITVVNQTKQYDGEVLNLPAALADQVTVEGLLDGDTLAGLSYTYANADSGNGRLNAGVETVTPKDAVISGTHTQANYYTVRYISGTLEVTRINVTINIEPDRWTGAKYNGEPYKTGFTNPTKEIADYIIISHEGYAAAYLNAIWEKVNKAPVTGSNYSSVQYDAAAVGLGYVAIAEKDVGDYTYYIDFTPSDLPVNDNYSVSLYVRSGRLQIVAVPMTITITGNKASFTYDGTEKTAEGYTATSDNALFDASKVVYDGTAAVTETNVGTYPMGLDKELFSYDDPNFTDVTFVVTDGELKINKATMTITITGDKKAYTYDGTEKTAEGYTATSESKLFDESKIVFNGTDKVTKTDAGTYPMGLAEDQFSYSDENIDVTFTVTDGELKINKATMTITVTGDKKEYTYDGTEKKAEGYTATSESELFDESKIVFTGTAQVAETDAGTYPMGLAKDQFSYSDENIDVTFTVADGELKINKATLTITITGDKKEYTYDGTEKKAEGYTATSESKLFDESKIVFTGTALVAETDAGTYPMGLAAAQFSYNDANFENVTFNVTDGELKINKATLTITITGDKKEYTFDGTEKKAEGYTATSESELFDESKIVFTGTALVAEIEAGTYPMGLAASQFSYDDANFENVVFNVTDGQLVITPIDEVVVTITGNNNTATYDGKEHTVTGYTVEISNPLYTEEDFTFSGTAEAKRTEIGTTNMNLASTQFENKNANFKKVTFNVVDGYQTIKPLEITITVTGHTGTEVYNGEEQKVEGYDLSCDNDLFDAELVKFSGEAVASGTEVGTYPMGLAEDQFSYDNANITVTFEVTDGQLEITPVDEVVVTIVGKNNTATYDGKEHTVTGYTVEISNPLYIEADFTFSGTAEAKRMDVGQTDMGLAEDQFANTNKNFKKVTFQVTDGYQKIEPLKVTVTITGNKDSKVYNGEEQKVEGYEVEISDALYTENDFTFSGEAVAKGTDVDKYPMGLAEDQFTNNNANFEVTFVVNDGELEITPVTDEVVVKITGHNNTATYDATEHAVEGYDVEISNTLYKEADFTFSGTAEAKRTDVGQTDMGLAADQFKNISKNFTNVKFEVTDGYQKIEPLKVTVTITGNKDSKVYNGEEQKVEGYEVEISDKLYTEADFSFSGEAVAKGTDVDKYPMGLAEDQFTNNNANFEVTFVVNDGELEITPVTDEVVVKITGHNNTATYDATEHAVEGYDVEISNTLYKEADFTFSGTAEAKRTDVGQTDMGLAADQFKNISKNFTNVKFEVTDGYQKIEPLKVTVTITGNKDSKVYNGEEQKVEGYEVEISDKLYTEADFTFSGEAVAKGTDVDKYPMGLAEDQFTNNNENFEVTFVVNDGELEITPVTDEVVVKITGHNNTATYDATEHAVEGYDVEISNELYKEADFTFSGTAEAKRTDVGQTDMGLAADQFKNISKNFTNVKFEVTDGYQKIEPLKVTVTITGNKDSKVYNGSEQKVEGYEVEISDKLYTEADFSFSGEAVAKGTEVGKYPMGLAEDQFTNNNANFEVTFVVNDGELEITPVTDEVVVTITGNNNTATYDGKEHSVTGYTVEISNELYKEADFTFSGTAEAKRTDVGQTDMGLAADQFKNISKNFTNVKFEVTDGYQKIEPLKVTVTITGNKDSKVYNGEEQKVEGYEVEISDKLYTEADFTFSGEAVAKGTDVDKYPMGLAEDQFTNNNENFEVTFVVNDGELEITPVTDEVVVKITGHNNTATYDATEHAVEGYDVEISNELYKEADFTFSGTAEAKRTDVGQTDMGLAADQFKNISKNFTNVKFEVTDGYQKIEPLKVTVTITGNKDSKVYNGSEQKVEGYEVEISDKLYTEADFTFSGEAVAKGTDVDKYPMGLAEDQFTNNNENFEVTFVVNDGELEITPAPLTIKIDDKTKVYGDADPEFTYTVSGIAEGEELPEGFLKLTRDPGEDVGEYLIHGELSKVMNRALRAAKFSANNYDITIEEGTLTITPKTVTVTANDANKTQGQADPEFTVTIEGLVDGDSESEIAYTIDREPGEAPGTYAINVSGDEEQGNYIVVYVPGTLTIDRQIIDENPPLAVFGTFSFYFISDTMMAKDDEARNGAYKAMIDWAAENREALGSLAVVGSGNMVAQYDDADAWKFAKDTLNTLPAELPYFNAAGRTDVNGDEMNYDAYISNNLNKASEKYEDGKVWYQLFEEQNVMLLGIGYMKPAETDEEQEAQDAWIAYVNEALAAHEDFFVILTMNDYIDANGELTAFGALVEERIVAENENVELILSGNANGAAHRTQTYGERTVDAIMYNYQADEAKGLGFMRIITIDGDTNTITIATYSPVMDTDTYDESKPENDFIVIENAF